MKKNNIWKTMSVWLRAFWILALVFLLLGLGTLGSVRSTGGSYALRVQSSGAGKEPSVIFHVTEPGHSDDEDTGHVHRTLYVKRVLINVGNVYSAIDPLGGSDANRSATVRLSRSTSETSFYNYVDLVVSNVLKVSEAKEGEEAPKPEPADDMFNWLEFEVPEGGWALSTYGWYQLTARGQNVLINEIVFIGNESDDSGKPIVLKAEISEKSNLPYGTVEDAAKLIDRQYIPSLAQSSFFRYSNEELYTLMTVSEMRMGDLLLDTDNTYNIDNVYNSLGTDLVALGVGIFGVSPFGLRFVPFLAAFGALVFGFLFVKKLTGSDRAGFFFAVLYALSGITLSLGHLGTPLMIGVFFVTASLYFCYCYYADGMKKANFASALPALLSGLFGAAAICTNGALLIPVAGIAGLFVAGMIRHNRAETAKLDAAIDEAIAEEKELSGEAAETAETEIKTRAVKAYSEARLKKTLPASVFFALLVFGALFLSMISVVPLYHTYSKAFASQNIFYFMWRAFAGGFVGANATGLLQSRFFHIFFRGTGEVYAVSATGLLPAIAAVLAGIAGAVLIFVRYLRGGEAPFKERVVFTLILLIGVALSIVMGSLLNSGGMDFILLCCFFLFCLAAYAAHLGEQEESRAVKALPLVFAGLLAVGFVLFAVFTFSIPLPAGLVAGLLG